MPPASRPNERVASAAGAMAEAAERQSPAFIEHGLSPDLVAQLRSAAAALGTAMGSRDGNQCRRIERTRKVRELVKRGTRALRLLHPIMQVRLVDDPSGRAAGGNVQALKETRGAERLPQSQEVEQDAA